MDELILSNHQDTQHPISGLERIGTLINPLSTDVTGLSSQRRFALAGETLFDPSEYQANTRLALDSIFGSVVKIITTVNQAIDSTKDTLTGLVNNPQLDNIIGIAFGVNYNHSTADNLLNQFAQNNFTQAPHVELVSGQTFNGAYAKENNTIYLSQEFVADNVGNLDAIKGVLLEEFGHYLDSQINVQDAAGDEGDIFSRLVRGNSISYEELSPLKIEDDRANIFLNGKVISVEQQWINGDGGNNTRYGTNYDDQIYGYNGNDFLYGNNGNDLIYGGGNDDKLWGGNQNDKLWGEDGSDELRGDDGNDELRGGGNDDKLWGGNQDDKLWGEDGSDELVGDSGNDELNGGNNDDKLWGSGNNDKLWGENGNDILNGYGFSDYERDTLSGGGNADRFILGDANNVYYSKNGAYDFATITDFNRYEDVIHLKKLSLDASSSTQAWGYRLVTVGSNTEIRLDNNGDTIAVLQGVSGLNLTSQGFAFEGNLPSDKLPFGKFYAEYYNNRSLSGNPSFIRNDSNIQNDWGNGGLGNGVGNDNFSVRWTGRFNFNDGDYLFHALADDGVRMWVDNDLIIDQWKDQGATEYQAIRNLSGQHQIKVEYYENGGGAVAKAWWENNPIPVGQWQGQYYNNRSLSGNPSFIRNDGNIQNDWGNGGPGNGVGNDNFSVRWTGKFNFNGGDYLFHALADDGVRMWVDKDLIIDQWKDQGATEYQAIRNLSGQHQIKVEYYENGGGAVAKAWWENNPIPVGQWQGQYFNNRSLSGNSTFVRNDGEIKNDWGNGGPGNGVGNDNFSVRWTGKFDFGSGGDYIFRTVSDDGIRMWVDGNLIIDQWNDHGATEYNAIRNLSGQHQVKVEYYENGGGAIAKAWWENKPIPVGNWKAEFFNNIDRAGTPALVQDWGSSNQNFSRDWGNGSPGVGVNSDNFSARVTTQRYFAPGVYQIQTNSDDGVRVRIGNQTVIDKLIDQGSTNHYGSFTSSGGMFNVSIEYYERGGGANLNFFAYTPVDGSIGNLYREIGGANSKLGLSIYGEIKQDDQITIVREFEKGKIYNNRLTGETEVIYNKDDLPSWLRYEKLAKETIYSSDKLAKETIYSSDKLSDQLSNYSLKKVIDFSKTTGFYALGMTSKNLDDGRPPVIVFRGSGDPYDFIDDLNPLGIGLTQFENAKSDISALLDKLASETGKKADVIGHSLGGALAQLTAVEFINKVGKVITFNSTGINELSVRNFDARGGRNLKVVHYITEGDPVSYGGQKFINGTMIQVKGSGGFSVETASKTALTLAYLGAIAPSIALLLGVGQGVSDNHKEQYVNSNKQKTIISVDDFNNSSVRKVVDSARTAIGTSLLASPIGSYYLSEWILKGASWAIVTLKTLLKF
jgi:Ca2+-binding RTX toxin-like protein